MARQPEAWVTLATRIPKTLRRDVKVYCVARNLAVMEFVAQAVAEKLRRSARK